MYLCSEHMLYLHGSTMFTNGEEVKNKETLSTPRWNMTSRVSTRQLKNSGFESVNMTVIMLQNRQDSHIKTRVVWRKRFRHTQSPDSCLFPWQLRRIDKHLHLAQTTSLNVGMCEGAEDMRRPTSEHRLHPTKPLCNPVCFTLQHPIANSS